MARAANGALMESGVADIELDGSGDGTATITLTQPFLSAPAVFLQPISADSGTWSITASSSTKATVTASSSDTTSAYVRLAWWAVERR